MKKIMLICMFLVGITAVSRAQGGMRMSTADRVKGMQASLKLTDDQVAKVTAVYDAQTKSMDSLRTAGAGREAMAPLRKTTNDKVMAILTDDQKKAYQKMQDEMRARMQNGGGGGGTPPPNK
ncbi:Spy/CpxP family protein refolding chaperone [Mucilaginibacter glaciei]|uniref:Spy/CpxP family protein refolding chaperone n=1 Tax=Mucilaginibacter glaciei TaxID=2772109 RepID=A0A926NNT8_9SPHI|nr:Spy/CpxP family protein refolding chaperone [Mucilaginibacter glaciei]MBD1391895.1 Spy/CpxP family protein refolding chaperone [Mucilaginibacter glaciei]